MVVYGKWVTFSVVCFAISVGVVSSYLLQINWLLGPMQIIMILVSIFTVLDMHSSDTALYAAAYNVPFLSLFKGLVGIIPNTRACP